MTPPASCLQPGQRCSLFLQHPSVKGSKAASLQTHTQALGWPNKVETFLCWLEEASQGVKTRSTGSGVQVSWHSMGKSSSAS